MHRLRGRERPVIFARPRARAAMLHDHRRRLAGRDQDVGERLVVAHQHVEARTQPLDQVRFEQQRLGLGGGRDELDLRGRGDHAHDARGVPGHARIRDDALADALRLADVEHLAFRIDHAVDAGRRRGMLGGALDRRRPTRKRTGRRLDVLDRRQADLVLDFVVEEVDVGLDIGLGVVRQHGRKIGIRRPRGQHCSWALRSMSDAK